MTTERNTQSKPPEVHASGRRYRISTNRGQARKRIRYVESGGNAAKGEQCPLCQEQLV